MATIFLRNWKGLLIGGSIPHSPRVPPTHGFLHSRMNRMNHKGVRHTADVLDSCLPEYILRISISFHPTYVC